MLEVQLIAVRPIVFSCAKSADTDAKLTAIHLSFLSFMEMSQSITGRAIQDKTYHEEIVTRNEEIRLTYSISISIILDAFFLVYIIRSGIF